MKKCKRKAINKYFFSIKFKKWKIYFGPLVLAALKCYFGDNGNKMQNSFKTLILKNAALMAIASNLWVALICVKNNVFQLLHEIKNIHRSKFYQ